MHIYGTALQSRVGFYVNQVFANGQEWIVRKGEAVRQCQPEREGEEDDTSYDTSEGDDCNSDYEQESGWTPNAPRIVHSFVQ